MKYTILLSLVILLHYSAKAQDLEKNIQAAFQPGEHLHYKLKYGIFTAAEADLQVSNTDTKFEGKSCFHIVADGRTSGTFDIFYKVRNRYESYIDCTTLMPYQYKENRREGKYRHSDNVVFNHADNKITATKGVFPFTGKIFDFPSA